ncbi:MAG: hypothetical protein ACYC02_05930 [Thiobacillus sp.]
MEKQAFTITEFCEAYKVSRGRLHELEQAGLAPKTYRIESKPYVSLSAAQEWQARMEAGAAANFKPLPAKNPGQRGRASHKAAA